MLGALGLVSLELTRSASYVYDPSGFHPTCIGIASFALPAEALDTLSAFVRSYRKVALAPTRARPEAERSRSPHTIYTVQYQSSALPEANH